MQATSNALAHAKAVAKAATVANAEMSQFWNLLGGLGSFSSSVSANLDLGALSLSNNKTHTSMMHLTLPSQFADHMRLLRSGDFGADGVDANDHVRSHLMVRREPYQYHRVAPNVAATLRQRLFRLQAIRTTRKRTIKSIAALKDRISEERAKLRQVKAGSVDDGNDADADDDDEDDQGVKHRHKRARISGRRSRRRSKEEENDEESTKEEDDKAKTTNVLESTSPSVSQPPSPPSPSSSSSSVAQAPRKPSSSDGVAPMEVENRASSQNDGQADTEVALLRYLHRGVLSNREETPYALVSRLVASGGNRNSHQQQQQHEQQPDKDEQQHEAVYYDKEQLRDAVRRVMHAPSRDGRGGAFDDMSRLLRVKHRLPSQLTVKRLLARRAKDHGLDGVSESAVQLTLDALEAHLKNIITAAAKKQRLMLPVETVTEQVQRLVDAATGPCENQSKRNGGAAKADAEKAEESETVSAARRRLKLAETLSRSERNVIGVQAVYQAVKSRPHAAALAADIATVSEKLILSGAGVGATGTIP
eukprot:TRINITY_DN66088_c5_g10_i1.p1 TRINITY_DN66088_c5_g10~~TRINITY_DN66088_c5_g10_i1.p1  ORF type:complete len:596 (-),score=288.47 TRINITY_DN66088_c5_g10_i1:42-1643(-)